MSGEFADLEHELAAEVEGDVRFDAGSRAMYASDASNFRQPPIGVVLPRTIADVEAVHEICHRHEAPILSRGAGTSLSGETVNHAVVIDFSRHLDQILEIDEHRRTARVQPGAINQAVNQQARRHGLVFAPDPSTHTYCTIGGNIGNNSCGIHSLLARAAGKGSRTSDSVESLEVLTYDGTRMQVGPTSPDELDRVVAGGGRTGEIHAALRALRDRHADLIRERFVDIPRRVSGFNLDELLPENGCNVARALVGTEGTCATVLEATVELVPDPPHKALLVIGYEDIFSAARHVTSILEHQPSACEAMDRGLYQGGITGSLPASLVALFPRGGAWVIVELGGETGEAAVRGAERLATSLGDRSDPPMDMAVIDDPRHVAAVWRVRASGIGATAYPPDGSGDHWPGWEDSAVHPEVMGPYLRDLQRLYDDFGFTGPMYGHLGDGCIHSRINFDLRTEGGVRRYREFMEAAADLVVSYGGSLSGEHGDGQQRGELLPRMYGEELTEAFREFKRIWDPHWKMNPGKVVDARRFDQDLRIRAQPPAPETTFTWIHDDGDFAHAAARCVGMGACVRRHGTDVMCPSYMATREEKHSTRGRARLLFEMLQGEIITDGWRSKEVKEALDLCLSCKGCTNDCPVNVDMPTYKAEFLHHHWSGRLRPRHAYAFGYIDRFLRLGSKIPRTANLVLRTPGVGSILKKAAGVTTERSAPELATQTLQKWCAEREGRASGVPVLLWPDTFNNYLHPEVGRAAVEALEAAGYRVLMPKGHVCCGRPLYDHGFLASAEKYLRRSLDAIRDEIRAGIPVVGMEPSCLATFKDELAKLLPHDADGARLRDNAVHFAELFAADDIEVPTRSGEAIVWGHCHQKATGGITMEKHVLERMGFDVREVTGGCCGLAGSWGFEKGHYDLSLQCGEEALLPAVRDASPETLVVANGFSCQTQISHGTERRAYHLAEVLTGRHL